MKKTSTLLALFLVLSLSRAHGEFSAAEQEEIIKVLDDIPLPHMITQALYAIRHPDRAGADEAERSRVSIGRARAAIPKLRRLLKVGSSVFDYPGLVARGTIIAAARAHEKYELHVAAHCVFEEGFMFPDEFTLTFDERGIITSVDDIVYKR